MKLGFTGTRKGMTFQQRAAVAALLDSLVPHAVHHGCCLGADEDFSTLARCYDFPPWQVGHPCDIGSMTSALALARCDSVHDEMPPLVRNRIIVDETDQLLACPEGFEEVKRSGTWSTVRYARFRRRRVVLVMPDGSVREENP